MGGENPAVIPRRQERAGYGRRKSSSYTPLPRAGGVWEEKIQQLYPAAKSRRGMGGGNVAAIPRCQEQAGYGRRKSSSYTPPQRASGV